MAGILDLFGPFGQAGTPGINPQAPDQRAGILNPMLAGGLPPNTSGGILGNFLGELGTSLSALGGPLGQEANRMGMARRESQIRNQLLLDQIQQRRKRQEALQQLPGLLGGTTEVQAPTTAISPSGLLAASEEGLDVNTPTPVPTMQTPEGQQQVLGLLGQIAPEAFTQGILGQMFPSERAEPSLVREIRALEDPTLTTEQRNLLRKNLEADPAVTDQQLKLLDTRLKMLQIEQEATKLSEGTKTREQSRAGLISGLARDIKDAKRLADINDSLRATLGETGVPFSDVRRAAASGFAAVQDLFGIDSSGAKRVVNLMDEFNKISSRFAAQSATRLFDDNNITNFQLQTISQATPSLSIGAEANDRVIADTLEILLDGADNANIPVKDREDIERMVRKLRGMLRAEDLPGFDKLPPGEQAELRRRMNRGN